jgi:hypothetical protein
MKCFPLFPVGSFILGLLVLPASGQDDPIAPPADSETATGEAENLIASEGAVEGVTEANVFKLADLNQDGWLSGTEVGPYRAYDADGDGEVTELEFMAGRSRDRIEVAEGLITTEDIERFAAFDSTSSGYLSGTDIIRASAGGYDADFDGRVTRIEYFQGRDRDRRRAAELEARLAEQRRRENERRRNAGEAVDAPAWGEVLTPRKGFMIGWVTTIDGEPLPEFTIEIAAYDVAEDSIVMKMEGEPEMIGRFKARDGYYEVRLPDGSFGFVASVILEGPDGPTKYPLRGEGRVLSQLDYVEIDRSSEGVVKNLVWEYSLDDLP